MKKNEVRMVNANQNQMKVYFHLVNGKTVVRMMQAAEIINANRIGHLNGEDARVEEYVRLFNEQYSDPQTVGHVELSASEKRFFELQNMSKVMPLDAEQEEEMKQLMNE